VLSHRFCRRAVLDYVPQWPEAIHAFWVDKNMNGLGCWKPCSDRNLLKFQRWKAASGDRRLDTPVGNYTAIRGELTTPNNQATDLLGGPAE